MTSPETKRTPAETDAQFEQVYDALRRRARRLVRTRPDASLAPTALVHEVWERVRRGVSWQDETHFKAIAARAMRQILADRARRRRAGKRGGDWHQVTLGLAVVPEHTVDVVILDQALGRLEQIDPRLGEIVVLRVFGGLTHDEVGRELGVSERTARQEWRTARAWLVSWLGEERATSSS